MTRIHIAGLILLVAGPTSSFASLVVGTGNRLVTNGGKNWLYTIEPEVLLTQFPATGPIDDTQTTNIWGATWDGADTVYFSSPDGTGAVGPLGNAVYLWSYSISDGLTGTCSDGSCYTEIGMVTDDNGVELRMDGLAFDNGTLYSWNQDEMSNEAGLYSISLGGPIPPGPVATLVAIADPSFDDIKGIDATDGVIYGLDDSTGAVVTMDVGTGLVSFLTDYPSGVTDIDGLAAGEGKLYLVGAGEFEEINVLDLATLTYDPTIAGVFPIADEFSGAAFFQVPEPTSTLLASMSLLGILGLLSRRR